MSDAPFNLEPYEPPAFADTVLPRASLVRGLLANLAQGIPARQACALVGLGYATYQLWLRKGEAGEHPFDLLSVEIERAWAHGCAFHLARVHASSDWRPHAWKLARLDRETYGRNADLPVANGTEGGAADLDALMKLVVSIMNPAQRAELRTLLRAHAGAAEAVTGHDAGGDDDGRNEGGDDIRDGGSGREI